MQTSLRTPKYVHSIEASVFQGLPVKLSVGMATHTLVYQRDMAMFLECRVSAH